MRKPRVVVAEFKHETNCFCPDKAGRKEYEARYLKDSGEVIPFFKGTRTEIGGVIEASEKERFEVVPVIAANANPCGLVAREMFEFVRDEIVQTIRDTENVDGVFLALHGAMVAEGAPDGEGTLLKAIRNVVGPRTPIVATLDLHGNMTDAMVENANAFFPFETNPHIDGFERGYEAGKCLARMMRREISTVMKLRRIPILTCPIETDSEPYLELFVKRVHKWEEDPGVVNVAIMHGFNPSDIPETSMSVMAITDGDSKLAEDIVDDMARRVWGMRDKFKKRFLSPEEAVKEAMGFPSGLVVLADSADNPGGGGTGDSTFILRALIEAEARNVGLAFIRDPESVEQAISAGVGSKVKLSLGGKLGSIGATGGPVEITAMVKTIADGQFFNKGPMMKGILNNIGHTVVLDADGIEIIVAERRAQALDAEIFRRVGIEPTEKKIVVLKSTLHFKACFGPMAKKILIVNAPGPISQSFESLKNISRPIYPIDEDFEYII